MTTVNTKQTTLGDVTSCYFILQVIDAQQAERTTGNDVTEEEPHPYTISFFLFPHKQTVESSESKGNKTSHITQHDKKKLNSTKGNYPWCFLKQRMQL